MERELISKEHAQEVIQEIIIEINSIINAAKDYNDVVKLEYDESNLYFIKVLIDMFSNDEKTKGLGFQANRMSELSKDVLKILGI